MAYGYRRITVLLQDAVGMWTGSVQRICDGKRCGCQKTEARAGYG